MCNKPLVINLCDELSEYDVEHISDALWCVSYYAQGDYEGSGKAVVCRGADQFELWELGHCSCYGPMEAGAYATLTREQVKHIGEVDENGKQRTERDYDWHEWQALSAAVNKLLSGERDNDYDAN